MFPLLDSGVEVMSRIIKTVSLDDQSAKLAEQLPNFSHFVRECLYRNAISTATECTRNKPERFQGRCNPLEGITCYVCWPNGLPERKAVAQWSNDKLTMEWLDEQARASNQHLIDMAVINRKASISRSTPPIERKKKGILSRLFRSQK